MIGTAGHVDHGKTSLIRALTDTDTDRLPEEKARGLTIDLGFASLTLPDGRVVSVVDVPGHERFIGNMIVGALGVEVALLCVSATSGVSAQTHEHLQILDLLPVRSLVVALTFCDLADVETRALAALSVRETLSSTRFREAEIVETSAVTGEGLDNLKESLGALMKSKVEPSARWYLPIDRSFIVKGQGRVATGTLMVGEVKSGSMAMAQPGDRPLRVRQIQSHFTQSESVVAVARVAFNLSGQDSDSVVRGDLVGAPGVAFSTTRLDARLRFVRTPQHGQRVRLHVGADEVMGTLFLNDHQNDLAQIKLERLAGAAAGQPVIVRRYSPPEVIGGGVVLVPVAEPRRRSAKPVVASESLDLVSLISDSPHGISGDRLAQLAGRRLQDLSPELSRLSEAKQIIGFAGHWMTLEQAKNAQLRLLKSLEQSHAAKPENRVFPVAGIVNRAGLHLREKALEKFLQAIARSGRIVMQGGMIGHPKRAPRLSDKQRMFLDRVIHLLNESGAMPPTASELAEALRVPLQAVDQIIQVGINAGELTRLVDNIVFSTSGLESVIDRARIALPRSFTAAEFRDAVQTSRKFAIPLLEWMDAHGRTVRRGDHRHWTSPSPNE
ncbi:MAG: selenocysteine-specific translation elongation factor [Fimbriimonadaceae bacterium]|nr:selenocysteine-specific translation elongation factor [Fimbriimonadaceae bacterium]